MDFPASVLTHLGVFLLGVVTWLPFTLWEGHHIKNRGDTMTKRRRERSSFSRSQTVAALALIMSLVVLAMGVQQMSFQRRQVAQAQCYQQWGRDVTDSLTARSEAGTRLSKAQQRRDNSVDNVLLVALSATQADPPLPDSQQREEFIKALTRFGQAKRNLVHVNAGYEKTKRDNTYPQLDCNK